VRSVYPLVRRLAARASARSRGRRAAFFRERMRPRRGMSILDLGGSDGAFMAAILDGVAAEVTVADVSDAPLQAGHRYGFRGVVLEDEGPLPFPDGEFDVVFCNSVIEHVTLPKEDCERRGYGRREWRERSLERQTAFAREIRRVGRAYFVQTPHRHFPIEAHTWLPAVNWLSHRSTRVLLRVSDRFWVKYCGVADWHLLDVQDMQSLFPDSAIRVERALGLPKSIIAYGPRRD
jgi:hypothetical protein